MKKVAVLMGSEKDLPIMKKALDALSRFGAEFEAHVCSAHRSPDRVRDFSRSAEAEGFGVIIAGAGKAAHLAGAVAANTSLPVIGVPLSASHMDGLDALLSTVQMPTGVPVATVAVDGAGNAAILACQILALADNDLAERVREYRRDMSEKAEQADRELREEIKMFAAWK